MGRLLPDGECVVVAAFRGHDRRTAGMCGAVKTETGLVLKRKRISLRHLVEETCTDSCGICFFCGKLFFRVKWRSSLKRHTRARTSFNRATTRPETTIGRCRSAAPLFFFPFFPTKLPLFPGFLNRERERNSDIYLKKRATGFFPLPLSSIGSVLNYARNTNPMIYPWDAREAFPEKKTMSTFQLNRQRPVKFLVYKCPCVLFYTRRCQQTLSQVGSP